MALYKYHYIELDTKRSPRISLQNIVAGETGNVFWITVTNNGETIDMSTKENDDFIYRVSLRIRSDLGVRRQDSDDPNGGITFVEENTGDHGKINILLSADSFTAGKNRCRLEIYSKRTEDDDTLICSAEWTFDAAGNPTGDNSGVAYPMMAYYEQLAKSWAVGGTGKREGEDTDNAKYYKDLVIAAIVQGVVSPSVEDWLDENADRLALLKEYVTPEMYGAYGDGTHDDTAAVQSAVNSGKIVWGHGKTYKVSNIMIQYSCDVRDCDFFVESKASTGTIEGYAFLIDADNLNVSFSGCTFRSTNDRNTSSDYVNGNTSNICLVGGTHATSCVTFDRCSFMNAYYSIYLKRDTISKFRCTDCAFIGHVMGVDIAYCQDAIIEGCTFSQNTASTGKAHDVYVAEGTGNKVLIKNCEIVSSSPTIGGNHGTGYDITVENCIIYSTVQKPFIATQPDSGTIVQNKFTVRHSTIICAGCVAALEHNTVYMFDGCDITCTGSNATLITRTSSSSTQNGSATFDHCRIDSGRLTYAFGATFNECTIKLAAGTYRIIENAGTSLYCCKCIYTSTNGSPIKANGNCIICNNYFENTEMTEKAVYVASTGNVIKGNTFVNIPNASYGSADLTNNIFVS